MSELVTEVWSCGGEDECPGCEDCAHNHDYDPWEDEPDEGKVCSSCGKPFEEFGDLGCQRCDVRVRP